MVMGFVAWGLKWCRFVCNKKIYCQTQTKGMADTPPPMPPRREGLRKLTDVEAETPDLGTVVASTSKTNYVHRYDVVGYLSCFGLNFFFRFRAVEVSAGQTLWMVYNARRLGIPVRVGLSSGGVVVE